MERGEVSPAGWSGVGCHNSRPERSLQLAFPSNELASFEIETSRHRISVAADWDAYRQLKDR